MTGPIVTCVSGKSSLTASAKICAQSWRIKSTPSSSEAVKTAISQSLSITVAKSTASPLILSAKAFFASDFEIDWAKAMPVKGSSNCRLAPSGRVSVIIFYSFLPV